MAGQDAVDLEAGVVDVGVGVARVVERSRVHTTGDAMVAPHVEGGDRIVVVGGGLGAPGDGVSAGCGAGKRSGRWRGAAGSVAGVAWKEGDGGEAAAERARIKRATAERAMVERATAERARVERAAAERARIQRAAAERARIERATAERARVEKETNAWEERGELDGLGRRSGARHG